MYSSTWGGIINYEIEKAFTYVYPCTTRKATKEELDEVEKICRGIKTEPKKSVIAPFMPKSAPGEISKDQMEEMLADGLNQKEIAEKTGIDFDIVGEKIIEWDFVDLAVMNEDEEALAKEYGIEVAPKEEPWEPVSLPDDGTYWSVSASGEVEEYLEGDDLAQDELRKAARNFFLDRNEAEKRAERIRRAFGL